MDGWGGDEGGGFAVCFEFTLMDKINVGGVIWVQRCALINRMILAHVEIKR